MGLIPCLLQYINDEWMNFVDGDFREAKAASLKATECYVKNTIFY